MKKIAIILVAAAATLVSCQKENVYNGEMTQLTFTVKREAPTSDSKAVLSGTSVVFEDNDNLSVFSGDDTNYLFETTKGGDEAEFTGSAGSAASYLIASPYNDSYLQKSASVLQYTIPEVQVATPGSADPNALISIGKGFPGSSVTLYNAVALFQIVVPDGLTVKNIQIGGGRGSTMGICGVFQFNTNEKTITPVTMSSVITLVPQPGQSTIAPGTYYVAVRPKPDYDNGLVVAYVNGSNQLCKRVTSKEMPTFYVYRNHILPLGSLNTADYTAVSGTAVLRTNGDDVQFTGRVKKLAGGSGIATEANTTIKKIVFKSHSLYPQTYKTSTNLVSSGAGTQEIHAYVEGDVLKVCTEGPKFTLQASSGDLFRDFTALEEVIFDDVDTQASTSFSYMFRNDTNLKKVDFGNADLSKVTNFSIMIANCGKLEYLSFGETAIASSANVEKALKNITGIKYLYFGSNFSLPSNCNEFLTGAAGVSKSCDLYCSQAMYDALVSTDIAGFTPAYFTHHAL